MDKQIVNVDNRALTVLALSALEVGRQNHMVFRVVQPEQYESWELIPLWQDRPLPADARRRLDLLMKAGIGIQDCIVAHEVVERRPEKRTAQIPQIPWKPILSVLAGIVAVVAMLATVVALAVVAIGVMAVATVVTIFGGLLLADPDLIVVLEDGTWLSVCSWV